MKVDEICDERIKKNLEDMFEKGYWHKKVVTLMDENDGRKNRAHSTNPAYVG